MKEYSLTQDTLSVLSKIDQIADIKANQRISEQANQYLRNIGRQLSQIVPSDVKVNTYKETEIEQALETKLSGFLAANPMAIGIILDRFLLSEMQQEAEFNNRLFRFSMCRTVGGDKVPRQSAPSFAEQFKNFQARFPDFDARPIAIIDDGIFTGGTINRFIEEAQQNGVDLSVQKIFGFLGDGGVSRFEKAESANRVADLYEWVDLRDFSIFGGKQLAASRGNKVATAIPYLYPWSNGEGGSLNTSPQLFNLSKAMIEELEQLVIVYQTETGKKLTFRDLVKAGYPLPTNLKKSIPITINTRLIAYLGQIKELIAQEQTRPVYIFDMDGTLYKLDGKNSGFAKSSLEKIVLKNAVRFVMSREQVSFEQAAQIIQTAQQDEIGISNFISLRYGISCEEYFNEVWDINPEGIVNSFRDLKKVFVSMKGRNPSAKLILLTTAPKVWAERVLAYLGIAEYFEDLYTGEKFGQKDEIFRIIAGRYQNATSIGDQIETDILPARAVGIKGIRVAVSGDLPDILNKIK